MLVWIVNWRQTWFYYFCLSLLVFLPRKNYYVRADGLNSNVYRAPLYRLFDALCVYQRGIRIFMFFCAHGEMD